MTTATTPATLGRYQILGELGRGAMGVVYEALDPLIERKVAIKTIRMDLSSAEREQFEQRFFREAKSAGQLIHPNIVTIFDAGKSDDLAYIAMEVLAGPNLRDLLDKQTPITPSEIANITAQAAEALAFAHERGIVHRDIKPGNIVLLESRHVKIADFGIAQLPSGSRTLAGTVLGSPKYMSPEQVAGKEVDGRSDIFSLGVVLYELLTGEPPFDGDNMSAIMYQVINTEPPPPTKINPRLPTVFNNILARAMHKKPEQRYASAREMARDLREAEAELAIAPVAASSRTAPPRQTTPQPADATLLILPDPTKAADLAATVITPPVEMPPVQETQPEKAAGGGRLAVTEENITQPTMSKPATDTPARPAASRSGHTAARWTGGLLATLLVLAVVGGTAWWISQRVVHNLQAVEPAPQPDSEPAKPASLPQAHTQSALPDSNLAAPAPEPKQQTAALRGPATTPAATEESKADNKPAAEAKKQPAVLTLSIQPWGEIYIDGELKGVSPPLTTLNVPAGKHKFEIRNSTLPAYQATITLKEGEKRKVRYSFE